MARSAKQSSKRWRFLANGILIAGALLAPANAAAEIIIDDFDDPVRIVLPEMENQTVITSRVGVLNAERSIGASSSQTDPIGMVDVNFTKPSNMTGHIEGQNLDNPLNTPLLAFGARYDFASPVDLTEGGVSDAVLIDMTIFQGSGIPGDLSVGVVEGNGVFLAFVSRFRLLSETPYTLTLPFSSFGPRGGGAGGANFSAIESLWLSVRLLSGSRNLDTNWFVQIDRVRVGRMVPEPHPGALFAFGMLFCAKSRFSRNCRRAR